MIRVALILLVAGFAAHAKQRSNGVSAPWDRLIQFVDPGWVDVPTNRNKEGDESNGSPGNAGAGSVGTASGNGLGSSATGGTGSTGAGGAGSGSGSMGASGGSGSGNTNSGDGQSVEFRDDLAKGTNDRATPTEGNGGADHQNPPGGGGGGNGSAAPEAFAQAFPVCVFMDESVSNGNQVVKGMVDQAANCQVNLVTFPIYVSSNYPNNPDALKELLRNKCNAVTGMQRMGMNRASVVLLSGNSNLPKTMCGNPNANSADVPYCAEMGFDPGGGLSERLPYTGRWGGIAGPGRTAVAVVGPDGHNPRDVSAAALGQAMMALPPGSSAGNGVGDFTQGAAGDGAVEPGTPEGWTQAGCERMRATAFPNVNGRWKYKSDQRIYVVKGGSARLYELTSDRPLFRDPNAPPAGTGGGGGGGGVGGGGGAGGGGQAGSLFAEDISGKHKKAPGGGGGGRSGGSGSSGQVTSLRGSGGGLSAAAASAFDQNFFGLGESMLVDDYTGTGDPPENRESVRTERDAATSDPSIRSIRESTQPETGEGGESTSIVFDDSAKRPSGESVSSISSDSGNSELASAAVPAPGDPVFGPAGPSAGAPLGAETSIGTEAALLGEEKPKLEGEGEGDAEGKDEEEEDAKSEGGRDLASLEEEPCPEGEEGERCRAEREAEKEKQGFLDDDFFEKLKLPESADDRPKGEWRPRAPRSLSEGVIQIGR